MLADGRTVTLKRYQEFRGPTELFQPRTESDYWLEFKHPDSGETVRWESDRDLATVALMVDGGRPRLLVSPHFGSSIDRYRCPDPVYFLFELQDGRWKQLPLETLKGRRVVPNVTYSVSSSRRRIEEEGKRLSADNTNEIASRGFEGRAIDFRQLERQTFGTRCFPPFNLMLEPREKRDVRGDKAQLRRAEYGFV